MATRSVFADPIEAPNLATKIVAKDGTDDAGYVTIEDVGGLALTVPVTATGTTTATTLADSFPVSDLRRFGMECDGATNDSVAFMSFMATAPTGVYLLPGTMLIDPDIYTAGSAISIIGLHPSISKIQLTGSVLPEVGGVLYYLSKDGWTLANFTLDMNNAISATGLTAGIRALACSNVKIDNVSVINGASPTIVNQNVCLVYLQFVSDFEISGGTFALSAPSTHQNQSIAITNDGGISTNGVVRNTTSVNAALALYGGTYMTFSDNDVSGWGFGSGFYGHTTSDTNNVIVVGNRFHDADTTIDDNATRTIGIETWCDYTVLANNVIYNVGGTGITFGGKYNSITGNVIRKIGRNDADAPYAAIHARYNDASIHGSYATICGNTAVFDAGQTYGYEEENAGITDNVVGINNFSGADASAGPMNILSNTTRVFQPFGAATGYLNPRTLPSIDVRDTVGALGGSSITRPANVITVANGDSEDVANYSCLVALKDGAGNAAMYFMNAGGGTLIVDSGGQYVAPTTTPAAGKASIAYSGSAYALYNNTGGALVVTIFSVLIGG